MHPAPHVGYYFLTLLFAGLLVALGEPAAQAQSIDDALLSPDGKKAVIVTIVEPEVGFGRGVLSVFRKHPLFGNWGSPVVIVSEGSNFNPRWSPDSSKIVFQSLRLVPGTTDDFNTDIFVVKPDGSGEVNLTNLHPAQDHFPSWSPDGTKIAFLSDRNEPVNFGLWVIDADGSSVVNIAEQAAIWPDPWVGNDTLRFHSGDAEYTANADGTGEPTPTFPASPQITQSSIVLATLAPIESVLSPLSLASVFGLGLATGQSEGPTLSEDGTITTEGAGSCVKIGGLYAPILSVTQRQINFQVPAETPIGPNQVVVLRNCGGEEPEVSSIPVTIAIERASPGFFRYFNFVVAARFNDGMIVAPDGVLQDERGRPSRGAKPGEIISIYGTGWGPTTASSGTGELVQEAAELLPEASPSVVFGGQRLPASSILYIGSAPGTAGLYQMNLVVPDTPGPADRNIELTVYGKTSPDTPGPADRNIELTVYGKTSPVGPTISVAAH